MSEVEPAETALSRLKLISGGSAQQIANSIRDLVDSGVLAPKDQLPPVRELAQDLEVNRNTVVSAYGLLVQAGVAETRGRRGTRVASVVTPAWEGTESKNFDDVVDLASGNPHPKLLPSVAQALQHVAVETPILYGHGTIDPELEHWMQTSFSTDVPVVSEHRCSVTAGSAEGLARLLSISLIPGDSVGLEDPCFLSSINTSSAAGYDAIPIPVDSEGMTVTGLQEAIERGVRVVVVTPRAHNPSGVSLTQQRAQALRSVFAENPHVLVVVDDHYWMLASQPYFSVIPDNHPRWALLRSVSVGLGPDLRCALVLTDPGTHLKLASQINAGSQWVSHILQKLTFRLLSDPETARISELAKTHYKTRNREFMGHLSQDRRDLPHTHDGLNLWLDTGQDADQVTDLLASSGWLVRSGNEFSLMDNESQFIRLTVHEMSDAEMIQLAGDLTLALD